MEVKTSAVSLAPSAGNEWKYPDGRLLPVQRSEGCNGSTSALHEGLLLAVS